YQSMLEHGSGIPLLGRRCRLLADQVRAALETPIDPDLLARLAACETIYFTGRNDGVAEELVLKAYALLGKKAAFLEGSAALSAGARVMNSSAAIICIEPCAAGLELLRHLASAPTIVVLSVHPSDFPTLLIPESDLQPYVFLAAGWNLLVVAAKFGH